MVSELYLIAHKVRGEPAFDVAIRCDDMGTEEDPGPWWIISTSGHRAYPYGWMPLEIAFECCPGLTNSMPTDWPDHYTTSHAPKASPIDLLKSLGLAKPVDESIRRV